MWVLSIFVLLVVLPILLWPKLIAIGAVMLLLVRIITLWGNRQHQNYYLTLRMTVGS